MLLHEKGQFYQDDELVEATNVNPKKIEAGRAKTMAYKIIKEHNTSHSMTDLRLKFDAIASHDITYVSIIQTAKASGIDHFPIPYVLTNCHNSLCAVGGTINADDHRFGLSAAKKIWWYLCAASCSSHSPVHARNDGWGRQNDSWFG